MTMDAVIERATSQSVRLGHNYVGTEHALLAIVDDEPALLEPYGVTREKLLQVLAMELLRIVVEVRDARSIVEPVRQAAEQYSGTELSAPKGFSGITGRLAAVLDDARSPSDHTCSPRFSMRTATLPSSSWIGSVSRSTNFDDAWIEPCPRPTSIDSGSPPRRRDPSRRRLVAFRLIAHERIWPDASVTRPAPARTQNVRQRFGRFRRHEKHAPSGSYGRLMK